MFSWANKVRVFAHWKYSYMYSNRKNVNFLCGSNILMVVFFFPGRSWSWGSGVCFILEEIGWRGRAPGPSLAPTPDSWENSAHPPHLHPASWEPTSLLQQWQKDMVIHSKPESGNAGGTALDSIAPHLFSGERSFPEGDELDFWTERGELSEGPLAENRGKEIQAGNLVEVHGISQDTYSSLPSPLNRTQIL